MGFFNWNKKKKIKLTETEKYELEKDQQLLSAVANINAQNGSYQSSLASLPSFRKVPPLIYACRIGKIFMVKNALINGSDVNETDEEGITPLHAAAEGGFLEIVQILLEQGADKNMLTKNGALPVELARNKSHESIVKLLSK